MNTTLHITSKFSFKYLIYHFLYWIFAVLLLFYVFSNRQYDLNLRLLLVGVMTSISITVSLVISRFLIPKLLFKERKFLFYYMLTATFIVTLWLLILMILMVIVVTIDERPGLVVPTREDMVILVSGTLLVVGVYSVIHFIRESYQKLLEKQELERIRENMELKLSDAKLSLLKSQVNPHFIFNVLNNIYSLVNDKPTITRNYILKFSGLLDLMLYEFNKKTVPLIKEIEFIQHFIELERLRHDDDFNVEFISDLLDTDVEIAPLIFFPFVENAFKFGFSDALKSNIKIELHQSDTELVFMVKNRFDGSANKGSKSSGIGLENIKERLELIYKNMYVLEMDSNEAFYSIMVKIKI